MKTFKESVLALISAKPGIQDTEIATELNYDVDEVYPVIRAEVLNQQVLVENVGTKNRTFRMNTAHLGWKSPQTGSAPAAAASTQTKPEKAIAYIEKHGPVTTKQLKVAMGLKPKEVPSQYLGAALKHGKIERDGDNWFLGTAVSAKPATPEKASAVAPAASRTSRKTAPVKPAHIPQDAVVSSMSIGDLRLIFWKGGNLVVSANDNTIDLAPVQVNALRAFVALM
jgi:hypothetical protein